MENLNAEQIIKALEWCSELRLCVDCPMREEGYFSHSGNTCRKALMETALSLIKELTEENESLEAEKEHLEKVVEGKLKRTSALKKSVLVLTEDNHILATELKRVQEENERLRAVGAWVLEHGSYGKMICSVCGHQCPTERKHDPYEDYQMTDFYATSPYCPNCGSKMKGE